MQIFKSKYYYWVHLILRICGLVLLWMTSNFWKVLQDPPGQRPSPNLNMKTLAFPMWILGTKIEHWDLPRLKRISLSKVKKIRPFLMTTQLHKPSMITEQWKKSSTDMDKTACSSSVKKMRVRHNDKCIFWGYTWCS